MKIDFNEKGMTINFDKAPKLLYFNEEGVGNGSIFLNGVQRKGLIDVRIQAHTREEGPAPRVKYRIQYLDKDSPGQPQLISNMEESIAIGVRILDLEQFQRYTNLVMKCLYDERIPEEIRKEYFDILRESPKKETEEDKNGH